MKKKREHVALQRTDVPTKRFIKNLDVFLLFLKYKRNVIIVQDQKNPLWFTEVSSNDSFSDLYLPLYTQHNEVI